MGYYPEVDPEVLFQQITFKKKADPMGRKWSHCGRFYITHEPTAKTNKRKRWLFDSQSKSRPVPFTTVKKAQEYANEVIGKELQVIQRVKETDQEYATRMWLLGITVKSARALAEQIIKKKRLGFTPA